MNRNYLLLVEQFEKRLLSLPIVYGFILAFIYYLSFWSLIFKPLLIFGFIVFFLFVRMVLKREYVAVLWTILALTLLQNVTYGIFSGITAHFKGIDQTFVILGSSYGKVFSYALLEAKLLFSGVFVLCISILDLQNLLARKHISWVRGILYLLTIWVFLAACISVLSNTSNSFLATIGSIRNYLSLIVVVLMGSFLTEQHGQKDEPLQFEHFFPSESMRIMIWTITIINIGTNYVISAAFSFWQHGLGVRFIYYAKLLFATIPAANALEGRFYTDLLGKVFLRSGGIYLEPVNYGFLLVFMLIFVLQLILRQKKLIDVLLAGILSALLVINFGKGAFLVLFLIVMTFILLQFLYSASNRVKIVWASIVFNLLATVFIIAPLLSTYTLGHFEPMVDFMQYIGKDPELLILGQGVGTAGNYTAIATFRESAVIVTLAELGILWFSLYSVVILLTSLSIFQSKNPTLVKSFGAVAVLLFIISGLFQENAFSLQISLFMVLPAMLLLKGNSATNRLSTS